MTGHCASPPWLFLTPHACVTGDFVSKNYRSIYRIRWSCNCYFLVILMYIVLRVTQPTYLLKQDYCMSCVTSRVGYINHEANVKLKWWMVAVFLTSYVAAWLYCPYSGVILQIHRTGAIKFSLYADRWLPGWKRHPILELLSLYSPVYLSPPRGSLMAGTSRSLTCLITCLRYHTEDIYMCHSIVIFLGWRQIQAMMLDL